jgi:lipopolysaccharide/colanic/teichoic acid biosynthesis glycosyltransferase
MFSYLFLKELFDRSVAFVILIVLMPLFLIIAFFIKIDSKGSILFLQNRLGKNGAVFKICKFRTMRTDTNFKTTETLATDPRITNFGKILRKTSLDEIPQLINIIKGEMSFIGPRPPLTTYPKIYNEYNEFERKRFNVKPGVSGLAAIKQREVHDWNLNIPVDVEYVEKISFKLDMKLFIASLFVFFKTDNIYSIKK